jgi:hypothetical protein
MSLWRLACSLILLVACGDDGKKPVPDDDGQELDAGDGDGDGDGDASDAGADASMGPIPPLTKTHSAKIPPENGALLGAFVQVDDGSTEDFREKEEVIGRRYVIDNRFYSGMDNWINDRTRWDVENHIIPLITWEQGGFDLVQLAEGAYDAILKLRAQQAKALGAEIFMRWGHEMNGNWYPWSGAMNGGMLGDGPGKYIRAWRHVHDVFKAEGADNVVWVWCPLVTDVPAEPWNHWANYYPGDEYVDWIGMDSYNWGSSSNCCVWQDFTTLTDALYQDYASMGKPLMLPETASAEVGGDKAAWIDDFHMLLKTKYSAIRAVVWFDIDKETDWRVDSSPKTLEAFKRMAHDPWFNPEP